MMATWINMRAAWVKWSALIFVCLQLAAYCAGDISQQSLEDLEAGQVKEMLKRQVKEEAKDLRKRGQRMWNNQTAPRDDRYMHPYMKEGIVRDVLRSYTRYRQMILLNEGKFWKGTNDPTSKTGEYPMVQVLVKGFYLDANPVINAEYWAFRKVKRFLKSDADRKGWSWVVDMFLSDETREYYSMPGQTGWAAVKGAKWDMPEGPDSNLDDRWKHPAVHVSWNDARIFCEFHGKRLPTEPEWEYAAKIGVTTHSYPWGDVWERRRANLWQGKWPTENTKIDGYSITSPVDAYRPQNVAGFYDLIGNVWEWTSSPYIEPSVERGLQPVLVVLKGGSYVDSVTGRFNYEVRNGQRMGQKQDYTAANVGFRCAMDLEPESRYRVPQPPTTTAAPAKRRRKIHRRRRDEL